MTAVTPATAAQQQTIHDLVPAGMIGSTGGMPVINAKYTIVGESLRRNTPGEMQCSMFCGGRRCKFENGDSWQKEDTALNGIYSHWITDDLLAMSRPNSDIIKTQKLIQQFQQKRIKSIINLQIPGEHASCGPKLDSSGFTYDPNDFMKEGIFFYNFGWKDYGEASMSSLLDMVKVLSFALNEGKVAIHCHAGLGRTGVLIASYLIYYLRVRSNDALRYVRLKRPGAVQTRRQIECVKEFEAYFLPQCIIFSKKPIGDTDKKNGRFNIDQYLKRQKHVLHGYEARSLKHIPKIIYKVCRRLLKLSNSSQIIQDEAFPKLFITYQYDNKCSKIFAYKSAPSTASTTPIDSMNITRRSSRLLLSEDESSRIPTQNASTSSSRPTSDTGLDTNSYVQSCSSALSGIDDKRLDEILGDGIINQSLNENLVSRELASHEIIQKNVKNIDLPKYTGEEIYKAFMEPHAEIFKAEGDGSWASSKTLLFKQYRSELNYKISAWDRLDTETNLFVLAALLCEWLEHLKHPVLDKDGITYVVIHCDNIEAALKKLPIHVSYILEYLVRFVAGIKPLSREKSEDLMRRIVASLTHQGVTIKDKMYPVGKKFPKLRGGTAESTLKFLMKLFDKVYVNEEINTEFGFLDELSDSMNSVKTTSTIQA